MENPWKTLDSKIVYKNPYWSVRDNRVVKPNGQEGQYYVMERGDSVMVVALSNNGTNVYLIRHWRYPLEVDSLEIPAGFIDEGETPLQAAQRELREETGLTAKDWQALGRGLVSPGITKEGYYIFLAREVSEGVQQLDSGEHIAVEPVPFHQIEPMIEAGQLIDGTSIDALYRAKLFLQKL